MGKGKRERATRKQSDEIVKRDIGRATERLVAKQVNEAMKAQDDRYWKSIVKMVLAALHSVFGFGPARLRRFYDAFDVFHDSLRERYDIREETTEWACDIILRKIGVDVDAWMAEAGDD